MKQFLFFLVLGTCLSSAVFAASERELFENGVLFLKQDKNQEAIDSFSALLEIEPQNANAYKNRGVAHLKLNQYDEAINDFEQVKKIIPDLKGLYSNIGVAWYYKQDYTRAIENYDKEIFLTPDNHLAYFNRAICRVELKDYEESLKDIIKTLELEPDFYPALCLKGDLHGNMNQVQPAKQAYERAILIEPQKAYAKTKLEDLMNRYDSMAKLPKKSSPVTTIAATPPSGAYELQVGAFQVQDNAQLMQKKLEKNGYKSRILEMTSRSKKSWYLVRTGLYTRQDEADSLRTILKKEMGLDAVIRPFDRF